MEVLDLCAAGESVTECFVLAFLHAYNFQKKLDDTLHAGSHF